MPASCQRNTQRRFETLDEVACPRGRSDLPFSPAPCAQVSERVVLAQKAYILFYIRAPPTNGHAARAPHAAHAARPATAPPLPRPSAARQQAPDRAAPPLRPSGAQPRAMSSLGERAVFGCQGQAQRAALQQQKRPGAVMQAAPPAKRPAEAAAAADGAAWLAQQERVRDKVVSPTCGILAKIV